MSSFNLRRHAIPLALAISGWLVVAITAAGAHTIVRPIAVFAFVLVVPGMALVRLLPIRDLLERAVLTLALGMSLALLIAEGADIGHVLQPVVVLAVLAAICSAAAITELAREARKSC